MSTPQGRGRGMTLPAWMTTTPKTPPQRNKEQGKYLLPVVVTPLEQNDEGCRGLESLSRKPSETAVSPHQVTTLEGEQCNVRPTSRGAIWHPAVIVHDGGNGVVTVKYSSTNTLEDVKLENIELLKEKRTRKRKPVVLFGITPVSSKRLETKTDLFKIAAGIATVGQDETRSILSPSVQDNRSNIIICIRNNMVINEIKKNVEQRSELKSCGKQSVTALSVTNAWGNHNEARPSVSNAWGKQSEKNVEQRSELKSWGEQSGTILSVTNAWGNHDEERPSVSNAWGEQHESRLSVSPPDELGFAYFNESKEKAFYHTPRHKLPRAKNNKLIPSRVIPKSEALVFLLKIVEEEFFLRWKFPGRLMVKEVKLSSECEHQLEISPTVNGFLYQLVATKVVDMGGGFGDHKPKCVKCYYVAESGPGKKAIVVKKELAKVANFADLSADKCAARMELMVSPAKNGKANPNQYEFRSEEFEEIVENHHVGCGFIPKEKLEEIFWVGTIITAVQVRIFAPKLGIFKGMLMLKNGIDKIQLPTSMRKVPPSIKKNSNDWVYFLINETFPSNSNKYMGRQLDPREKEPPPSSEDGKKDLAKSLREGKMGHNFFLNLGVPAEILSTYVSNCKQWKNVNHAYCVGVADPTNALPEGTVFMTGFGVDCNDHNIFITRFPCTDKGDGQFSRAICSKPEQMNKNDWEMLCSIHFGVLIFATPKDPGVKSIPETIADGDLDGDHYLICWDQDILSSIETASVDENTTTTLKNDPIVGITYQKKINGILINAKVVEAEDGGKYSVEIAGKQVSMTHADIMDGRGLVKNIINHRRKEHGWQVEILWDNGVNEWQAVDTYLKKELPDLLTEYAINHGLQNERGWNWVNKHIQYAEVSKIIGHCYRGKSMELEELYDDGTIDQVLMSRARLVYDQREKDILFEYAQDKNLLNTQGFLWLKKNSKQKAENWFENVQNSMGDLNRLNDYNKLTTQLHTALKNIRNSRNIGNDDIVELGRSYKQSLDIQKHGGKVKIPLHLRNEIKEKKLHKYLDFSLQA
mmetsp:Transcript_5833/g.7167  ORF Transcript_5833/g.7167 Transcript_5833/m.7167 type:complete len:1037 (-) Transcript_5833:125-3235(-)